MLAPLIVVDIDRLSDCCALGLSSRSSQTLVSPDRASSRARVSGKAKRDPWDNGRHQDIGPMTLRAFLSGTLRSRTASAVASLISLPGKISRDDLKHLDHVRPGRRLHRGFL
jgi:hypothetical protein